MHKKYKNKKGFTLLETLIAIMIMTVAVGSAFSMAQKSLQMSYQSRNQTTAYFLAAEGLELVRSVRDSVALYNYTKIGTSDQVGWTEPLDNCKHNKNCDIDPTADLSMFSGIDIVSEAVSICPNNLPCQLLEVLQSTGKTRYSWRTNGSLTSKNSIFSRAINISCIPSNCPENDKKEIVVTSTVTWLGQTISLTETLSNWYKIEYD